MIKQIGLPLRGRPILLITRMITDQIGPHSVLLPLPGNRLLPLLITIRSSRLGVRLYSLLRRSSRWEPAGCFICDTPCLVPRRLSLDENVPAKEGGKERYVPFPWSLAVHHRSVAFRARLYHAKNEAPKEEAVTRSRVSRILLFLER